ncbi:MAG: DUF4139 domain-containing protein [Phycisphaerales bacterium]|jgi:hypothetical protein
MTHSPCPFAPNHLPAAIATVALCTSIGVSAEVPSDEVSLTVYSSADPAGFDPQRFVSQQRQGYDSGFAWSVPGFGVVRSERTVALEAGMNELLFTDVAAFIDPTTVGFTDLTDPKTAVLEQSFRFDLVSPSKLLERYLDREIEIEREGPQRIESIRGTLLSANQGQVVLRTADGVRVIPMDGSQVSLPELPGGLLTRPALVWRLQAPTGGDHRIRATYQTGGMTWRSDYNLVLAGDETRADLTAWVSLMNLSGISFENARLKLVAGDVQRVQSRPPMMRGRTVEMMADSAAAGFEQQAFFEYHLYTLPRRTDLPMNSTQQIALFPPVTGFEVSKELLYAPTLGMGTFGDPMTRPNVGPSGQGKASVFVAFENREDNRLGMPLPAGKVRVFKQDPRDGTLEFVGEDMIDHTPRNELVRLRLGEAFDVVGERTIADFSVDTARKRMSETIEIEIRNQKDAPQKVTVRERLYRWRNWTIADTTVPERKIDASTVEWIVEVPAEGSKTIRYRVDYTW